VPTIFTEANLAVATLTGADLTDTIFVDAYFNEVDLSRTISLKAFLISTCLKGVNLEKNNTSLANLRDGSFSCTSPECDFSPVCSFG
jgi:uncharacterized protein YjbI with pentapeptide repeats